MGRVVVHVLLLCLIGQFGHGYVIDDRHTRSTSYQRTLIAIEVKHDFFEHVFLKGGFTSGHPDSCTGDGVAVDSNCSIPIRHIAPASAPEDYLSWSSGDEYLDFGEAEPDQGQDGEGYDASGTPTVKMTPRDALTVLNSEDLSPMRLLSHFWVVELDMDCSETDGYFEVEAIALTSRRPDKRFHQTNDNRGRPDRFLFSETQGRSDWRSHGPESPVQRYQPGPGENGPHRGQKAGRERDTKLTERRHNPRAGARLDHETVRRDAIRELQGRRSSSPLSQRNRRQTMPVSPRSERSRPNRHADRLSHDHRPDPKPRSMQDRKGTSWRPADTAESSGGKKQAGRARRLRPDGPIDASRSTDTTRQAGRGRRLRPDGPESDAKTDGRNPRPRPDVHGEARDEERPGRPIPDISRRGGFDTLRLAVERARVRSDVGKRMYDAGHGLRRRPDGPRREFDEAKPETTGTRPRPPTPGRDDRSKRDVSRWLHDHPHNDDVRRPHYTPGVYCLDEPPYQTSRHLGKCGSANVFHYKSPRCEINDLV